MSIFSSLPYKNQMRTAVFFVKNLGIGFEQIRVLRHYLTANLFPDLGDGAHLDATIGWLARAQDACGGDGVSNLFTLEAGWGVAYPETSGYILATFLAYSDYSGDKSYLDRAVRIGDWEIQIQAPNGGVYSSTKLCQTRVFNTGQVERTREKKYLEAAKRAGDYLLKLQDVDGAWRIDTYCGARTYHSRVDWSLLRLAQLTDDSCYEEAALKNLRWVLKQQHQNGWFDQCGFNDDQPIMHVIIYTLRGLLECAQMNNKLVDDLDLMGAVIKSANALCSALQKHPVRGLVGMVPAAFDQNWNGLDKDSCLTGNAQLSILLYRLTQCTGDSKYQKIANIVRDATKKTQVIETTLLNIKGGIAGSYPLSHGYASNAFPNWAAKFFSDALLMKINTRLVIKA